MRDNVSNEAKRMTSQLRESANAGEGLKRTLLGIAGAVGVGFGFASFKKHFVDFNSEMEQAKLTTAGFMAMSGLGTFNDDLGEADKLVKQYTLDARASIGTTADFVDMSKNLTAAVTGAGGSVADLHDMTKGLVISSKAMGMDPHFAAMETEEALMGVLTMRNRYAKKILQSIGYAGEEGRSRYQQLSADKRLSEFKRALGSAWLADLASAQEHSMAGATSTFMDNAQLAAMRAGKALFEAIKVDLNKWNEYLIANGESIDRIAESLGHKLVTGFTAIKDLTVFIAEHWKGIALIFGTLKVGGFVSGLAGSGGLAGMAAGSSGALASMFALAVKSRTSYDSLGMGITAPMKLSQFGAQLGIATVALTGFAVGLSALVNAGLNAQSERIGRIASQGAGTMGATLAAAKRGFGGENELRQQLYSAGLASDSGIDRKAFARAFRESNQDVDVWAKGLGLKSGGYVDDILNLLARRLAVWTPDRSGLNTGGMGWMDKYNIAAPKDTGKKGDIKVTIQRIEVTSDDPDRFAFGLDELVQTAASRRGLTPGYTPPAWRGAF
jgi:hypothetical protein